jgi:hypothetical protein
MRRDRLLTSRPNPALQRWGIPPPEKQGAALMRVHGHGGYLDCQAQFHKDGEEGDKWKAIRVRQKVLDLSA